ncbi:MAG TPA: methylenetetrahydrofolate reductase [NAD(P)H] [Gemmatales bacterium]|nr:methylenetetrahydrofolate reductase [NAD(P)H] [Gemmatales bacterium]HMP58098.1 methylenetetrahydrofolate reductase [NAD(P)H] [Gemmatales bacterium]
MRDLYPPGRLGLSFEIFPPKTREGLDALYVVVDELTAQQPLFISITYGAGGSTRDQSLEIARTIRERFGQKVTAHFTCVGSNRAEIRDWLAAADRLGVEHIMALRGDPPKGETEFKQAEGGLRYASELVALIRSEFPRFGIGVAGYPETHQEAVSPEADLENLKRKVDLGGDVIYTQLFFDNDDFFRFRDACVSRGITAPIVPGLLPVLNLKQIQRITTLCKAKLPTELLASLEARVDDPVGQLAVGVDWCAQQCRGLIAGGVPGLHFYVLNRADHIRRILAQMR